MKALSRFASLAAVSLVASLALGTAAQAQGPNKCLGSKNKCASKKMQGLLKCYNKAATAAANQDGVFTSCRNKAICKYDGVTGCPPPGSADKACFRKAEIKSDFCTGGANAGNECAASSACPGGSCSFGTTGCLTVGDKSPIETKVDNFVNDVVTELQNAGPTGGPVNPCEAAKDKCVLKKAAGLLKCHEKAVESGDSSGLSACLNKATCKYDGVTGCTPPGDATKACFAKAETKIPNCTATGDKTTIENKVDAFVTDVLCELGYQTLTCVTPTPTPTTTPCPTSTPGGTCPTTVQADADGANVDLDTGWTGLSHDAHVPSNARVTFTVSGCAGASPPCGVCNTSGPIQNAGGTAFNNHRCLGNTGIQCTSDLDCGVDGPCSFFFGPHLPLSAGGVAVCVTNQVSAPVTGTANIEAGTTETHIPLTSRVYLGNSNDAPCPRCGRNECVGGGNDGADCSTNSQCPGGACSNVLKCNGGDNNNLPCTVNGVSATFGSISFDCPPGAGSLIGTLPIPIDYTSGTATRSLSASNPNCRATGFQTLKCFCDTCDNSIENPCSSGADCSPRCVGGTNATATCTVDSECPTGACRGGTTCGGRRCRLGANAGQVCTTNSQCPGGACAVPGLATASNQCDNSTCSPNPADTDSSNEGVCAGGPTDFFCQPHATFGGCTSDGDCAQYNRCVGGTNQGATGCTGNSNCPAGTCEIQLCSGVKQRECFTDNGVTPACLGGANSGAACSVASECPGGGSCVPTHCFNGTNASQPCATLADCPDQSAGTFCGGGSVSASGLPYPPCGSVGTGKIAGLFCIPPTSAGSVNNVSGLPGLGRVTIPTTYTFN